MCPSRNSDHDRSANIRDTRRVFSQNLIDDLVPMEKDYAIQDRRTPGLYVKVTPAARKVFILRYRTKSGRQGKLTLGRYPLLSVSAARRMAMKAWSEISEGGDPSRNRQDYRQSMTVRSLAEKYLNDRVDPRAARSTYKQYASVLETRVLPRIGHLRAIDLRRSDIEDLHLSMRDAPVRANRMLSVVKAMLYKAEDWDIIPRGSNPAARIEMNPEKPRRHYFDDKEQVRIFAAISNLRMEMLRSESGFNAIMFLFFTGCRTTEALTLKWVDIDFEGKAATLHDTKTGEANLPLADEALSLLQSIATGAQSEWVFPGGVVGDRLKGLVRPWKRICAVAELPYARVKDIRHTVGTYVSKEGSLYSAQMVLRHSSPNTTRRYAHPFEATIRKDLNRAISKISENAKINLKNKQYQYVKY